MSDFDRYEADRWKQKAIELESELSAERKRARLPEELVERIRMQDKHTHIWRDPDLLADILAAVEQKENEE